MPASAGPPGASPRQPGDPDRPPDPEMEFRSKARLIMLALAIASGLYLAWQTAATLLLTLAGLLVAALLDACTRGLQHLFPLGRGACFAIVCVLISALIVMGVAWGGYTLVEQWDELHRVLVGQLTSLGKNLADLGVKAPGPGGRITDEQIARVLLPDPANLFGQARSVLGGAGDALLVLFIGFFVGLNPGAYRRSILSIVPRGRRPLVGEVIDDMAETLRWWTIGQMVTVLVIALSIAIGLMLLGTPGAVLLGLQAGFVNFIPYLGPIIGAVPIALAAASQGTSMVLWVLGFYVAIQAVEGYVITPLVQRRTVDLQPALALAAQMLMGTLFGAIGIALATPLLAVGRVAVIRLSGEDPHER
jgi:predicted PurR-regulated permease PerM